MIKAASGDDEEGDAEEGGEKVKAESEGADEFF